MAITLTGWNRTFVLGVGAGIGAVVGYKLAEKTTEEQKKLISMGAGAVIGTLATAYIIHMLKMS